MRDGSVNTVLLSECGRFGGANDFQSRAARVGPFTTGNALHDDPKGGCLDPVSDPDNPGFYVAAVTSFNDRGDRYCDGAVVYTGFNTVLPPNGPSCMEGDHNSGDGIITAGSYHSGGVQVGLGDGSVRFVSETIDAGDQNAAAVTSGQSPYGVWGALGSRYGGEVETEF